MDLKGKRAVLIAGHYMPEVGYLEVYMARTLAKMGLELLVITSDQVSPSKRVIVGKNYDSGTTKTEEGILVHRIKPMLTFGSMLVATGINERIRKFDPSFIFILGAGKIFPFPVFSLRTTAKTYSFFGEMSDYYLNPRPWVNLKNRILKGTIKRYVYNMAFKAVDTIVAYTPETGSILIDDLSYKANKKLLAKKLVESTLGYDPTMFYYDGKERETIRKEHGMENQDMVIVTSTRVTPSKRLEQVIDSVDRMNNSGLRVFYIIIGFHDDDYGKQLKKYIAEKEHAYRIICKPFLDHNSIRKHYNAADIGVWTKAAISIQESMGTGLSVLLSAKRSVAQLIDENVNGAYYREHGFYECLLQMVKKGKADRNTVLEYNQRFSYPNILTKVLEQK